MSRDKQIEEMADIIDRMEDNAYTYFDEPFANGERIAEVLYNAGYRKSTDVAEEIFAEIEERIATLEYQANTPRKTVKTEELRAQVNWVLHEVVPITIAELKKKYTEEGK